MLRQSVKSAGLIHADRVKGTLEMSKLRPIVTRGSSLSLLSLSVALNCNAPPTLPTIQVGLMVVDKAPLLCWPEESAAVAALPSSNAQYPINPVVDGGNAASVVNA